MKPFIAAVLAAIALGFGASLVLSGSQQLAYQAYSTSGVRLSHPGTNLVGHEWTGRPTEEDFHNDGGEKQSHDGANSKPS